ncbi:anti-sigma factor [Amycolatopsis thermalba]|uniref:anti-sigma factor n=1 Tax=Amycolatopsis thermalba TaxID=944492 RepID=UPI000E24674C|nr:anti-sigma factor [Amycolatopsis thermalba]
MNPDVHMLTGAYALDALDELERRRFEEHLTECPDCEREVAELRATTARLGAAVSETPPPALRDRVLKQVRQVRQEPPARRTATRSRNWTTRLLAAAAVIAIAVAAVSGVLAVRAERQVDTAQAQYAALTELLSAPDVRTVSGTDAGIAGEARLVVSPSRDRAMLTMSGMPDQPADVTYQAWTIDASGPRSAGVMGHAGTTGAPLMFTGLAGVRTVAVTVEPAGGSGRPTSAPVVVFTVPA